MAINKAKIVEGAQKLVTQGRLKEAIGEYQKILREEPKELNALNTIGDLYVRLNNIPEALQHFTTLADLYVGEGFLVRGIAMYKKISKLDPANVPASERLAELFSMQGLFTEARAQYLQVAETYLKNKKAQEAIKVLQKVVDLEPDNLQIQQRLAHLYKEHGRKREAVEIYLRGAERLMQRDQGDEALKWLEKATALAPENPQLLLMQARLLLEHDRATEAVELLGKIPALEEQPGGPELLLKCRIRLGETETAETLAEEIFSRNPRQFAGLLELAEQQAQQGELARSRALFGRIAEPALAEGDAGRVVRLLQRLVEGGEGEAADWLATAARRAGDREALVLALQHLAARAFEREEFEPARDFYDELVQLEPDVPEYAQRREQVREKLGLGAEPAPRAAAPAVEAAEVLAAGAAAETLLVQEDELDPDTRAYVAASLTDIDLFSTYGMNQKAIELAEQLIERVPGYLVVNERLLDFYLGAGNDQGVVRVARRLEQLYRQKGDTDRAEEVVQLAKPYEQKLSEATAAAVVEAEAVREVDLSSEWAALGEASPAEEAVVEPVEEVPAFPVEEVREEIGFYFDQGMLKEAQVALNRYTEQFPDEPVLAELRERLAAETAAAERAPAEAEAETAEEVEADEVEEAAATESVVETPAEPAPESAAEPAAVEAVEAAGGETYEVTLEEKPPEAGSMSADEFFSDLAKELDTALPAEAAASVESPEGVAGLAQVFDEFKHELEGVEEVEDIETHYNLGIAFKEMGLHDEAISEFQKVYKAAEKQAAYPNLIQCCSLLGLSFMEKGMPQIAVRWYERALQAPGLDPEGALALRYDMGVAHQQAGNRQAALDCFLEVYGLNVDFRDVSDRIRQLKQ